MDREEITYPVPCGLMYMLAVGHADKSFLQFDISINQETPRRILDCLADQKLLKCTGLQERSLHAAMYAPLAKAWHQRLIETL